MHCDYLKVIFSVFSAYLYKCAELSYQSFYCFSVRALKFLVACFNNLFFFSICIETSQIYQPSQSQSWGKFFSDSCWPKTTNPFLNVPLRLKQIIVFIGLSVARPKIVLSSVSVEKWQNVERNREGISSPFPPAIGRPFDFWGEGAGRLWLKKSIKQERKQNSHVELLVIYLRRIVMNIFDHVVSQ